MFALRQFFIMNYEYKSVLSSFLKAIHACAQNYSVRWSSLVACNVHDIVYVNTALLIKIVAKSDENGMKAKRMN